MVDLLNGKAKPIETKAAAPATLFKGQALRCFTILLLMGLYSSLKARLDLYGWEPLTAHPYRPGVDGTEQPALSFCCIFGGGAAAWLLPHQKKEQWVVIYLVSK